MFDAIHNDDVKELHIALKAGANINDCDDVGYPALHMASRRSSNVFLAALAAGPDLNALDHRGNTALHWAAGDHRFFDNGFAENGQALIDAGADLSIRNENGETALDKAKSKGCEPLVRAIETRQAENLRQQLEASTAQVAAWSPSPPQAPTEVVVDDAPAQHQRLRPQRL